MAVATTTNGTVADSLGVKSDDQLMIAFDRGERTAFDQLYSRYKQPLYNYFHRACGNPAEVDELFQNVWLRVIASASRYCNEGRFRSWIFTLAHNCLMDYYRKSSNQLMGMEESGSVATSLVDNNHGEVILAGAELKQFILFAISSLPREQREAVVLREQSGFSVKEIGNIQNISTEAAKSRLRYAYKKLRVLLKDKGL